VTVAQVRTIYSFKIDRVHVEDAFEPSLESGDSSPLLLAGGADG
jgi:hypothetical protein